MNWNESFSEGIMSFGSEPHHVNVAFSQHAGIYRLLVSRDDFVEQMANIASSFKSGQPLKVVVLGQEIVSVEV